MSGPTSAGGLGVYVHVPFCERICPYCDFAVEGVGRVSEALAVDFVGALEQELALQLREAPELRGRRLETVYLGGGTPGLLPAAQVERLLGSLVEAFGPLPEEVTLELNPGVQEVARLPGYREAGVTRLSVGVQSLNGEVLRRLGRAQSEEEARRGLMACLAAGFRSVSADLIFGAPSQTLDQLSSDLDQLLELGVPHLSAYALTLEPGTPLENAVRQGKQHLPDEDSEAEMFQRVRDRLKQAGREQYEISSYASKGQRSQHNQRYWLRHDVLGLGPSASSLIRNRRFKNPPERGLWQQGISCDSLRRVEDQQLDARQEAQEGVALGLRRLDGVDIEDYRARYGAAPLELFPTEIEELDRLGLIRQGPASLSLTEHGLLFADEVFLRFVGR